MNFEVRVTGQLDAFLARTAPDGASASDDRKGLRAGSGLSLFRIVPKVRTRSLNGYLARLMSWTSSTARTASSSSVRSRCGITPIWGGDQRMSRRSAPSPTRWQTRIMETDEPAPFARIGNPRRGENADDDGPLGGASRLTKVRRKARTSAVSLRWKGRP